MNVLVITLLSLLAPGTQREESYLGTLVAKEGKSLQFVISPFVEPQSIERLTRVSDLIAFAKIGTPLRSYVTANGRNVMTDFTVEVRESVFSRDGEVSTLTLSQWGGTAAVAGHTVTITYDPLPLLRPGAEVLLFLTRTGNTYQLANGYFGAFTVREGVATPVSRSGFDASYRSGRPLPDVLNEVAAHSASPHK